MSNNVIFKDLSDNEIFSYHNQQNYILLLEHSLPWISSGTFVAIYPNISTTPILKSDNVGWINWNTDATGNVLARGIYSEINSYIFDRNGETVSQNYYHNWYETQTNSVIYDSPFMGIGLALEKASLIVAPIRFQVLTNTGGRNVALGWDIDDNKDQWVGDNQFILQEGEVKDTICFYASAGTSTIKNKTVVLWPDETNTLIKIANTLRFIELVNNSNVESSILYPNFQLDNLIDHKDITITKYTNDIKLYYLRCDDKFLTQSLDLKNLDFNLFKDIVLISNKSQENTLNKFNIVLNYSESVKFQTFFNNITLAFNSYNENQKKLQNNSRNYIQGTSLQYTNEPYCFEGYDINDQQIKTYLNKLFDPVNKNFTSFDNLPTVSEFDVLTFINNLSKRNLSQDFSLSNIGYTNGIQTLKATRLASGQSQKQSANPPTIMISYFEEVNGN